MSKPGFAPTPLSPLNDNFGSRYGNLGGTPNDVAYSGGPYGVSRPSPQPSPPGSNHPSSSTDMSRPSVSGSSFNRPPSSASSMGRSSDGRMGFGGPPKQRPDSGRSQFKPDHEDALQRHYHVLKGYLRSHLQDETGKMKPNRARDKLLRLSVTQFMELSTDVYDELIRREDERSHRVANVPKSLPPKPNFHPKRNQARQKLSTLPIERFRQLATDVFYELERRIPRFVGGDIERPMSSASNASRGGMRPPPGPGFRGPPGPDGRPRMGSNVSNGTGAPNIQYPVFRPASPGPNGQAFVTRPSTASSDAGGYNRPLPKTFQSNTIVPNKSTMVEDTDDEGEVGEDAFGLNKVLSGNSESLSKDLELGDTSEDKDKIQAQEVEITELKEKIASLESRSSEKEAQDSHLADLEDKIESLEARLSEKDEEVEGLEGRLSEKEREFESLEIGLSEKEREVESLESTISEQEREVEGLKSRLSEQEREAEGLEISLLEREQEIEKLESRLLDKEQEIETHKGTLLDHERQLERIQSSGQDREEGLSAERNEWYALREELEQKHIDAQRLNDDLQRELEQLQRSKEQDEEGIRSRFNGELEDLRNQLTHAHRQTIGDLREQLENVHIQTSDLHGQVQAHEAENEELRRQLQSAQQLQQVANQGDHEHQIELLQEDLANQEKLTNEVRNEAMLYLREMRDLSRQNDFAVEQEEKLAARVAQLEREVETWRVRYSRVKAQNKSLRASTVGLGLPNSATAENLLREQSLVSEGGLVRDVDITRFQTAIDELLKAARQPDTELMLDCVKSVAICVQTITSNVGTDGYPTPSASPLLSPGSEMETHHPESVAKLKARVTGTANSLITATKQHASASGLSPVALLDAAASNLTASVVALIKAVGIRASSTSDLQSDMGEDVDEDEDDQEDMASFYDDRLSPPAVEDAMQAVPVHVSSPIEPKPAPLNIGRSNTTKKSNGWFGGWGLKTSVDETASDLQVNGSGHGPAEEYDPYR